MGQIRLVAYSLFAATIGDDPIPAALSFIWADRTDRARLGCTTLAGKARQHQRLSSGAGTVSCTPAGCYGRTPRGTITLAPFVT